VLLSSYGCNDKGLCKPRCGYYVTDKEKYRLGKSLSAATALQLVSPSNIPTDLIHMLPFVVIMLMLIIFARHSYLPSALGLTYFRAKQ